jgi:ABC-2 type transport system permease protein
MTTPNGVIAGAPAIAARRRPGGTLWPTLRAIYIIWYRDLLRFWRDRTRLLATFAQPLLYLLIFGTGLSSALSGSFGGSGAPAGFSYTQFIFPGIIGMSVLFSSMFAAVSIVWDREFGFLKEVLVAPIDRSAVAIGKALGGATQAMAQGLILLVLAPLIGVKLTVMSVVTLIPLVFVLAFALSAMGVAIASRMRSMQGFQMVMNFLVMPMFFLSGALFPLSGLPAWMTFLTRIDPAAYGIDPIRHVLLDGAGMPSALLDRMSLTVGNTTIPIVAEVGILLAFGIVVLGIAVRNFRVRD